jgi:hypothetical protein
MSEVISRPDGRIYKSRKVIAHLVTDEDEVPSGVMVLGTHDIGRARPLACSLVAEFVDSRDVPADPVTGWWRDGFEGGRRCWVNDSQGGRAGVWFREITDDPADLPR